MDKETYIKNNDFRIFMEWLVYNKIKRMVICGGEPTLHPEFLDIIKEIKKQQIKISLLTNLLCKSELLDVIDKKNIDTLMLNCDLPDCYNRFEKKLFSRNLDLLKNKNCKIILSYNIRKKNQEFEYIIPIAKSFNSKNISIRIDFARPTIVKSNNYLSVKNIFFYKDDLIDIILKLRRNYIRFQFDCPLPKCYFDETEIKELKLKLSNLQHNRCGNLVINPDLTYGSCPITRLNKNKITARMPIEEMCYSIENNKLLNTLKNETYILEKCKECENRANQECVAFCCAERYNFIQSNYQPDACG